MMSIGRAIIRGYASVKLQFLQNNGESAENPLLSSKLLLSNGLQLIRRSFTRRTPVQHWCSNTLDSHSNPSDSPSACRLSKLTELQFPLSARTRGQTGHPSPKSCLQDSPSSAVLGKTPAFPSPILSRLAAIRPMLSASKIPL